MSVKDERKAFGEELARLRQDRGVTLEDLARDTKIRQALLEALEGGQFDRLPPAVFVAGYLQAYGKRLEVDPERLVAKYRALLARESGEEGNEAPGRPAPPRKAGGALKVIVTLLVMGAAVAGGVYLWNRVRSTEEQPGAGVETEAPPAHRRRTASTEPVPAAREQAGAPSATGPGPGGTAPAEAPAGSPASQSAPAPVSPPSQPAPEARPGSREAAAQPPVQNVVPPAEPAAPAAPPLVAPETPAQAGDLVLQFSRPCWVELWADGRRKVYREVKAGERLAIVGKSFKAVTIGDSGAVTMQWHGAPLAFPAGSAKVVHDFMVPPAGGTGPATP